MDGSNRWKTRWPDKPIPEPLVSSLESRDPPIAPIPKSASLSAQAYEHIKAAIIAGDLVSGQLYSVNQFAEFLNVSRTPVREALLNLEREGLVSSQRNRGFQVVSPMRSDLEDIVGIRRLLEIPAMVNLAKMRPPPTQTFAKAREIYPELQAAANEGDLLEFLLLDRVFHLMLIDALGNRWLTSMVADLRDHMHLPGLRQLASSGQLHESGREHCYLLDALEQGDATKAGEIMASHLDRTLAEWSGQEHHRD